MIDTLLITHLHSDHITDLNDVVTTHWVMSPFRQPLRIWGPPGIRETVDGVRMDEYLRFEARVGRPFFLLEPG